MHGASSGITADITLSYSVRAVNTFFPLSSFISSAYFRSCDTAPSRSAPLIMASAVSSCAVSPSTEQKRTPRSILSASSSKRLCGLPTVRRIPRAASSLPPKGSISPECGLYAMAFTVKSLRERSAMMLFVNVTLAGCRPSA